MQKQFIVLLIIKNIQMRVILLLIFVGLLSRTNAQAIAAGERHSIARCNTGNVMSWGYNADGELGDSSLVYYSLVAVQAKTVTSITKVTAGGFHSLYLRSDSTVWACGYNLDGQLGDSTTGNKLAPFKITRIKGVTAIAAGNRHTLFLKANGEVWACGNNDDGQLGDKTTTGKLVPVKVKGLTGVKAIAAGDDHSLFLKSNGDVWACGNNISGQLGDGTISDRDTAFKVPNLSGITAIAGGLEHSLFLKNDSTVWACGGNSNGQLGIGSTAEQHTVVQVSGLTGITAIAGGGYHSLFVKRGNQAWSSGWNSHGQLAISTPTTQTLTPVQVTTLTSIIAVDAGYQHSLFLKNDGTVWAAGRNDYGRLGDGTSIQRNTAVQTISLCLVPAAPISIRENKLSAEKISFFPNPSQGKFLLENEQLKLKRVEVYNIQGQKIRTVEANGSSLIEIDMSGCPAGIYFGHCLGENGTERVAKMLKE
jgi:alpha-tubulin suppressor-like RCC1 family protein